MNSRREYTRKSEQTILAIRLANQLADTDYDFCTTWIMTTTERISMKDKRNAKVLLFLSLLFSLKHQPGEQDLFVGCA